MICALLLGHGFEIVEGRVFRYEPLASAGPSANRPMRQAWRRQPLRRTSRRPEAAADSTPQDGVRQKIIDVFTVRAARGAAGAEAFAQYAHELRGLLSQLQAGP